MRVLVVVAHPDDEVIWAGGTILRHPEWEWTVLSLCRSDDPDRAPRFYEAAEQMSVLGVMSDLDDSPVLAALSEDLDEITSRIKNLLPNREFGFILTHGKHGEYTRHERHEQVHTAVRGMVARGELTGRLAFFSYEDDGGLVTPRPDLRADLTITLTDKEFVRKRGLVSHVYGFPEGSFEYNACGRLEAFRASDRKRPAVFLRPLISFDKERGEDVAYSSYV